MLVLQRTTRKQVSSKVTAYQQKVGDNLDVCV